MKLQTEKEEKVDEQQIIGRKNQGKHNKKQKKKKVLKILFIIIFILIFCISLFIFLFFKTELFQEYKELWVQTAMSTMNHKYLATWFLSDDEIQAILNKYKVENKENSELHVVDTTGIKEDEEDAPKEKVNEINVEKITGSTYVGYVMTISDCSKVKLVDARKTSRGTQLSEICKNHNAIAGINAGSFRDPKRSWRWKYFK